MLQRGVFRIQSNIYDGAFLRKYLAGKSHWLFSPILDVWLSSKYPSVAGLSSYKDIFSRIMWCEPLLFVLSGYFRYIFKIAFGTRLLYWRSFNNFESSLILEFCIPFFRGSHRRCSVKKLKHFQSNFLSDNWRRPSYISSHVLGNSRFPKRCS